MKASSVVHLKSIRQCRLSSACCHLVQLGPRGEQLFGHLRHLVFGLKAQRQEVLVLRELATVQHRKRHLRFSTATPLPPP